MRTTTIPPSWPVTPRSWRQRPTRAQGLLLDRVPRATRLRFRAAFLEADGETATEVDA